MQLGVTSRAKYCKTHRYLGHKLNSKHKSTVQRKVLLVYDDDQLPNQLFKTFIDTRFLGRGLCSPNFEADSDIRRSLPPFFPEMKSPQHNFILKIEILEIGFGERRRRRDFPIQGFFVGGREINFFSS